LAWPPDLIVRSQRVVTPGGIRPASVHIRGGKILGVLDFGDVPAGCQVDEADPAALLPGVVDTHVSVNDPDSAAGTGFELTTRAAAAGGITTLMAMPLSGLAAQPMPSPRGPTITAEAVAAIRAGAAGRCHVDVGLWGGVVPGNARELMPMFDAGVFGFACSLESSSGQAMSEADLRVAMPAISRLRVPLLVHAELPGPIAGAAARRSTAGPLARFLTARRERRSYRAYLESRPKEAEIEAIALMIALGREFHTQIHIVHLSSADALTPLFHARSARLPITADTCPHYLSFVAEEISDGATAFKCDPPIRGRENREFLWAAVAGGLIQMVVSDHSPAPAAMKGRWSGDFTRAWAGISSLPLSLPATWTGASARRYSLEQVTEWMCRMPARLAGLDRKGAIEPGYDADLVVFDPDGEYTVGAGPLHADSRSPYAAKRLRGIVERTYLRGRRIYERGAPMDNNPAGRVLARKR
jgi:allantoinase